MSYFSHNGVRLRLHKTPEQAIARADAGIRDYYSPDGYTEGVTEVCWGVVVQQAETADPNADYRTHHYTLRDTGAIPAEDPEQEAREKRYQERLEAIADSVWELAGAEDPHEILTAIERGIERLKANQKPCVDCGGTGLQESGYGEQFPCGCGGLK